MKRLVILLSLAALISACGKKDETSGKTEGAESTEDKAAEPEKPADKPEAPAPDFSMWVPDAKQKAWQGSWLVKENGAVQAWTIAGDKVQTWDGEEEKAFTLAFEAPCRATFKNEQGMSFPRNFSVVEGKLRYGAGGYRRDAEAIFCDGSGAIYVLGADGKCSTWDEKFGKWEHKEGAECSIKKGEDGKEVFAHGSPNEGEWPIEGDAIVPKSSFPTEAVEGDFAAAKTARDEKASK
jgi:hypothetical protein